MPQNPFSNNEETSFEQGRSVNKPVKAVTAQATQQAKNITQDIVAQLYGVSDKSKDDATDPNAQNATQAKPQAPPPLPKLSGTSSVGDHAKYLARQKYLEKGDSKGAEDAMYHMQHYFDETIMTLEDKVKKERQKTEQKKQENKKQDEQEDEQRKQQLEEQNRELPRPVAKGRNRMGAGGKKPKTDMGLKMGQMKTETFRGSSG